MRTKMMKTTRITIWMKTIKALDIVTLICPTRKRNMV